MAALPPGWVSDYDGQRWFWIYTATNHTQYTFPKEGDEWPDYASFSDISFGNALLPAAELLPEERLESERQLRRRAATTGTAADGSSGPVTRMRHRTRRRSGDAEMDDGIGGSHLVDIFAQSGYLGPGAWEDVVAGGCASQQPSAPSSHTAVHAVVGAAPPPPPSVSELSADAATYASDVNLVQNLSASHGGVPPRRSQNPTESPQKGDFDGHSKELNRSGNTETHLYSFHEIADDVPLLDSREITPTTSSSFITTPPNLPELASASTALCAEEINPPPVELPDTQRTWLEPVPVPNLVNQYPVDMPCSVDDSDSSGGGGGDGRGAAHTRSRDGDEIPVVLRAESRGVRQQQQQASVVPELMRREMVHIDPFPRPLALRSHSKEAPPSRVAQCAETHKNNYEMSLHTGHSQETYHTTSAKEAAAGGRGGAGTSHSTDVYERLPSQSYCAHTQQLSLQTNLSFRPKAPLRSQPRMLLVNGCSDFPPQMGSAVPSIAQSPPIAPVITMTEATPVTATAPASLRQEVVLYSLDDAHTDQHDLYQNQRRIPFPKPTPALPSTTPHTNTDNEDNKNNKYTRTDQGMSKASNQASRRDDWNRTVASTQKRWGKIPSVLRPGPRSRC